MKNPADSPSVFDKSAALAERFVWLAETGSTNDDIAALARAEVDPAPHFTVVATDNQTAGRGRLGRTWVTTSGKSLAVSVLLRPSALPDSPDALAWLPLVAGLSMTEAVRAEVADAMRAPDAAADEQIALPAVTLKWPNDVLVNGFKVSGILTELLADIGAVVVGSGVNLTLDEHDLPTLTSTSLLLVTGSTADVDRLLARYLHGLRTRVDALTAAGGDADASGLRAEVTAACGTLGSRVRVELPGNDVLEGIADGLDVSGRLLVTDAHGVAHAVAAGDVTHLRLEA